MSHANVKLSSERPNRKKEHKRWLKWNPLERLVELYYEKLSDPKVKKL